MRQATKARMAAAGIGLLGLSNCGPGAPPASGNVSATECAVRLPPRPEPPSRAQPSPTGAAPESRVIVHAELALPPLLRALEERVPKQLAEGRLRIGPGGTVSYRVERGELSLRVTRSALLIEAPARARAEACRGDDCYARCEPEAHLVAEVPLMLRSDYRFSRASVTATFTRGCKVRTLGGLLTLDVTPTLQGALEPELQRVAREIDRQLPVLAPRLETAWQELAKPRELPLGGCFVLQPFGIIQGPFTPSDRALRARFAVQARPEVQTSCGRALESPPLPPLLSDAALPEEGVVRLGMVTPLEGVARAFEAAHPTRIAHAEVTSRGPGVDVALELRGRVCGDLGLEAALDFEADGKYVGLARPALWPREQERLGDSELDLAALTEAVRIAPLLSTEGFRTAAPALATSLSRAGLEVNATISSARGAGAVARGDELVAWLEARGAIHLELSELPER